MTEILNVGSSQPRPGDHHRSFNPSTRQKRRLLCLTAGAVLVCSSCSWIFSADDGDEMPPLGIEVVPGEVIEVKPQYFQTGSSSLSTDGEKYLKAAAKELVKSYESGEYTGPICVEGHSDSRGSTTRNLVLSQQRALGVEKVLKREDVRNEVSSVGRGESESHNVDSHVKARRVDILLASCDGGPDETETVVPPSTVEPPANLVNAGQLEGVSAG